MRVSLPKALAAFVRKQVEAGCYTDASAVACDAVGLLMRQERERKAELAVLKRRTTGSGRKVGAKARSKL